MRNSLLFGHLPNESTAGRVSGQLCITKKFNGGVRQRGWVIITSIFFEWHKVIEIWRTSDRHFIEFTHHHFPSKSRRYDKICCRGKADGCTVRRHFRQCACRFNEQKVVTKTQINRTSVKCSGSSDLNALKSSESSDVVRKAHKRKECVITATEIIDALSLSSANTTAENSAMKMGVKFGMRERDYEPRKVQGKQIPRFSSSCGASVQQRLFVFFLTIP